MSPSESEVEIKGYKPDDLVDLVNFRPDVVKSQWDSAVEKYARALEFLRDRCGGVRSNLLPKEAMILALSLALAQSREGWEEDLERWVWASFVLQEYRQGANTRAVKDAGELRQWSEDREIEPTMISDLKNDPGAAIASIEGRTSGNQLLVTGIAALLVKSGAKDWLVDPDNGVGYELSRGDRGIESHHVFPREFLASRGLPDDMVANRTPLTAKTNRSLGKDAPSTVGTREDLDKDAFGTHRIDYDLYIGEDLEKFLAKRKQELRHLLASATGVTELG